MKRLAPILVSACIVALSACAPEASTPPRPAAGATAADRARQVEQGLIPLEVVVGTVPAPASLQDRMRHYHVPGVSVAVIDGGRIVWAKGYGVRRAGDPAPVDTLTRFQAASISKVVTTVAALRLVEAGKLRLDDDVNGHLSAWRVPENAFTREQKVTLRRILTHTSGLTVSGFAGYERGQPVPTLLQVLTGTAPANSEAIQVDTVPGAAQRYSGGGFTVLQLMVQEAAGRPFETALDDLVLRPAGMIHSSFEQSLSPTAEAGVAWGHGEDGSAVEGGWRVHPELAAAGLWSTPSDLARLLMAIQRASAGQGHELLSPEMTREMLATQAGPSGLGFVVMGDGDARIFRHSGSNVGYRARMVGYVRGGRGAVVMTNGDAGSGLYEEILASIARVYGWPAGN